MATGNCCRDEERQQQKQIQQQGKFRCQWLQMLYVAWQQQYPQHFGVQDTHGAS